MRGRLIVIAALALVVAGWSQHHATAEGPYAGYPDSIAALGDSITQAADTTSYADHPEDSWATGTNPVINSLYSRLLALNPAIAGNRFNDSVSGARMTHLNGQAQNAVTQGAELVTILMGANDVCTSSEATMTSVATFQAQFEAAMQTLSTGLPNARIAVASIPDVHNLWVIVHDNSQAQFIWNYASICQALLANPTSMAPADVQRRANVRQRNMDFNDVLHDVCEQYIHCYFDNYVGFNTAFTPADVSTLDYFHPSLQGQALTAQLAWNMANGFSDGTPPSSLSQGVMGGGGTTVTLSATDASGVSGTEYKIDGGPYQRYTAPLLLGQGTVLTSRAVDVYGNTDATHTCVIPAWNWMPGDGDCDGYGETTSSELRAAETFLGTDPDDGCADTETFMDERGPAYGEPLSPWPTDLNDNGQTEFGDALAYYLVFNAQVGDANYRERFDLTGDGWNDFSDILTLAPFFNQYCTP